MLIFLLQQFKVKLVNRSRRTGFEITNIRFHEENIPTKSWHNIPTITNSEVEQAVDAVTKLFEERPIWSRFAVRNRLPGVHHPHIKT
jgi:general transcription factor 3C polypeptide 5 (transcription factor C subunit 1)